MQLWKAKKIAEEVVSLLSPYCREIIICGSVRRGKAEYIKDIDLVVHPIIETVERQPSLLAGLPGDHVVTVNYLLEFLTSRSVIDLGIEIVSVGKVKHRLHHHGGNIDIELYCVTDVRQWGVAVALRTGPAEFSARLAAFPLYLHWHITNQVIHQHEKGGRPGARIECKRGLACSLIVATPNEDDVFEVLGLPFIEPAARTPELLQQLERERLNIKEGSMWP